MLPALRFESFQTGFVPGSHAAAGVFALTRAAEISKEWGQTIYVAQIDLCKAFDRVTHCGHRRVESTKRLLAVCRDVRKNDDDGQYGFHVEHGEVEQSYVGARFATRRARVTFGIRPHSGTRAEATFDSMEAAR